MQFSMFKRVAVSVVAATAFAGVGMATAPAASATVRTDRWDHHRGWDRGWDRGHGHHRGWDRDCYWVPSHWRHGHYVRAHYVCDDDWTRARRA